MPQQISQYQERLPSCTYFLAFLITWGAFVVVGHIFPLGQVVQVPTPASEYSPLLHAVWTFPEQLYPAGQAVQEVAPLEEISVAPHDKQSETCVAPEFVR